MDRYSLLVHPDEDWGGLDNNGPWVRYLDAAAVIEQLKDEVTLSNDRFCELVKIRDGFVEELQAAKAQIERPKAHNDVLAHASDVAARLTTENEKLLAELEFLHGSSKTTIDAQAVTIDDLRKERDHAYAEYGTAKKALDNALKEIAEWTESYRRQGEERAELLKQRDTFDKLAQDRAIEIRGLREKAGAVPKKPERHPFLKWLETAYVAGWSRDASKQRLCEALDEYVNNNPPPEPPPDPRQPEGGWPDWPLREAYLNENPMVHKRSNPFTQLADFETWLREKGLLKE